MWFYPRKMVEPRQSRSFWFCRITWSRNMVEEHNDEDAVDGDGGRHLSHAEVEHGADVDDQEESAHNGESKHWRGNILCKRESKRKRKKYENEENAKKKKTEKDENEKKERPEVLVGQFSSLGEEKTSSLVPGQFTASTLKSVTAIMKLVLMM